MFPMAKQLDNKHAPLSTENPVWWEKLIFRSLRKDFQRRSSHVSNVVEVRCLCRKLVPRLPGEGTSLDVTHCLWPVSVGRVESPLV